MSIGGRDREALELARSRSFGGAFVAGLALEMQTRRLTVDVVGPLRGGTDGYAGTLTFFGASELALDNAAKSFPQSVAIQSLGLSYDDEGEVGRATLIGAAQWSVAWSFDGLSYAEHPAVLASLADDF